VLRTFIASQMKKNYIITFLKLRDIIKYLIKGEMKLNKWYKKIIELKFNSVLINLRLYLNDVNHFHLNKYTGYSNSSHLICSWCYDESHI